jgi:glutathione S-transferase
MRARLAVQSAQIACELREIVLRDKAPEFLTASPKGTVPVLQLPNGEVIEESRDIMLWALAQNDPENWMSPETGTLDDMLALVGACDGPFKRNLDLFKYSSRHPDRDPAEARDAAATFLMDLDERLQAQPFLFGHRVSFADRAIQPFVRQFANTDRAWFDAQSWAGLIRWLDNFTASGEFLSVMKKYPKWESGDSLTVFPHEAAYAS